MNKRPTIDRTSTPLRWRRSMLQLFVGLLLCGCSAAWADGEKERDYRKLPGFVDFAGLNVFNEDDAMVDIYLDGPLLTMVANMAGIAEPELSEVLSKLQLVRVQRFPLEDDDLETIDKKTAEMAKKLEDRGWMRAVRVREDTENIYVYFKFEGELVQGIAVMAIEEFDGASFVNIVGEIDPEQIGSLARKFNIDELDTNFDWKDHDRRRDRRRREDRR